MSPILKMKNVTSGGNVEQVSDLCSKQIMNKVRAAGDVRQMMKIVSPNLDIIANELAKLRAQIRIYDSGAKAELERLGAAEHAARSGDSEGVIASLKGVARWVMDFATKVGCSVVAKIIEKQIGL